MEPVVAHGDGVLLRVWLVPGSRTPGIDGIHGDRLKLRVRAKAQQGRANAEAEEFLTGLLGVSVRLARGPKGRGKAFAATGIDVRMARNRLGL